MHVALSRPWLRRSRHIRMLSRSDGDEAVSPAVFVHGANVHGEAVRLVGDPRPHLGQGDGRCGGPAPSYSCPRSSRRRVIANQHLTGGVAVAPTPARTIGNLYGRRSRAAARTQPLLVKSPYGGPPTASTPATNRSSTAADSFRPLATTPRSQIMRSLSLIRDQPSGACADG
jgi:hypothetical protein